MDNRSQRQRTWLKKSLIRVGTVGAVAVLGIALAVPAQASYSSGGGYTCPGYPGPSSVRTTSSGTLGHWVHKQKTSSGWTSRSGTRSTTGTVYTNFGYKKISGWEAYADKFSYASSTCV